MKEKVVITLSIAGFLGIMFISSNNKIENINSNISEEVLPLHIEDIPKEYIDDISPETTFVENQSVIPASNHFDITSCSLQSIKTDDFTFGEAFKYYRQCLGTDSSFIWKGQTYSTLLIEEIIIELADSAEVQTKSTKINEVSEIH